MLACLFTAETARVTIRSVTAVDRLTLTVTVNLFYVNFISLIELSIRYVAFVGQLCCAFCSVVLNCFKSRL